MQTHSEIKYIFFFHKFTRKLHKEETQRTSKRNDRNFQSSSHPKCKLRQYAYFDSLFLSLSTKLFLSFRKPNNVIFHFSIRKKKREKAQLLFTSSSSSIFRILELTSFCKFSFLLLVLLYCVFLLYIFKVYYTILSVNESQILLLFFIYIFRFGINFH